MSTLTVETQNPAAISVELVTHQDLTVCIENDAVFVVHVGEAGYDAAPLRFDNLQDVEHALGAELTVKILEAMFAI